jgi:hypothetical protein
MDTDRHTITPTSISRTPGAPGRSTVESPARIVPPVVGAADGRR